MPCLRRVTQVVTLDGDKGWNGIDSTENVYLNIAVLKNENWYHARFYNLFLQKSSYSSKSGWGITIIDKSYFFEPDIKSYP